MTRRRLARALLPIVGVCSLLAGSTCDNQDFSGRFTIELPEDGASAVRAFRQPYIGRLILDFGLLNPGGTTASYELSAQAQTTGAVDAIACENATGVVRTLEAVADPNTETAPTLRSLDQLHAVTLEPRDDGGFEASLDLRIRNSGTYRLYQDLPDATLTLTSDGVALPSTDAVAQHTTCDVLQSSTSFVLAEGTYRLTMRAPTEQVQILVEEACTSIRTVPATCPGAAGDLVVRETITLAPGGFVSGRINSLDLGVGDQAVVALRCVAPEDCAASLELFFLVQQLECRTDNDCRARESCSNDAYCVDVPGSGCASAPRGAAVPGLGLLLAALLGGRLRRRGR